MDISKFRVEPLVSSIEMSEGCKHSIHRIILSGLELENDLPSLCLKSHRCLPQSVIEFMIAGIDEAIDAAIADVMYGSND